MNGRGRIVLPGLIDCHNHLIHYGVLLNKLNLRGVQSIEELKSQVRKRAAQTLPAAWIQGRGWDQDRLREKRYPDRFDLDEASGENPVALTRICGHILVANSLALRTAGITESTPDPPGGVIDRNPATGEPTGILRENATDLLWSAVPSPSEPEYEKAALAAMKDANRVGLTSVHCIINTAEELRVLQKLRNSGRLTVRFYVLIQAENLDAFRMLGLQTGFGDDWVRVGSLKVFADGSLGARTAAVNAPYNDDPSTSGIAIYSQEKLNNVATAAQNSGLQLAVHAIGDRAVSMALEAIKSALKNAGREQSASRNPLRHRIEHASVLNPDLICGIAEAGVVASVQPHFVVSDYWVEDRLGSERARYTYPFKSLIRAGVRTVGSSDCPVEPLSPLLGVQAAVERSGKNPEQKLSITEALGLYTREAAYASFEEDIKGTIETGKLADLVMLSRDPRKVRTTRIGAVKVEMTIVGGEIVYS